MPKKINKSKVKRKKLKVFKLDETTETQTIDGRDYGKFCRICHSLIHEARTAQARMNNMCQKCQDEVRL